MMLHAWNNYEKFAWGQNELRPISRSGHSAGIFGQSAVGATIIDAADTLYIMGLQDEYKKARDWIAESFSFDSVSEHILYSWKFGMQLNLVVLAVGFSIAKITV